MKFDGPLTCPFCGHKGTDFKLIKDWAHGLHLVNRLTCSNCSGDFRYYWGEKMDGTPFNYTIPKPVKEKS